MERIMQPRALVNVRKAAVESLDVLNMQVTL